MCAERDESELDGLDPGLRAYASSDPPDQPVTRSHSNADRADKARAGPDSSDDAGKAGNDEESGLHLPHLPHLPVPQLIEPEEDRWRWRARIRRDPRQLFFYRIGVGVAGLVLMIAAILTGPLPGPGGIPLFLMGLAVWSSEFEWANRLMGRFKKLVDRYRGWSRARRILFWVAVIVGAWTFFYVGTLIYGIPPWLPDSASGWLRHLPGVA